MTLTTTGSIEYLFKQETAGASSFVFGGSGGTNSRWYFLNFNSTDTVGSMTLGALTTQPAVLGAGTSVPYVVGNWYYVAQTWSISGGTATMNAYVANLTGGNTTLTQTVSGATNAHNAGLSYIMAIGSNTANANFFTGGVDAVAIYNTALAGSTFQSHLDEIYAIPEPSTVALFVLGFGVVGWVRRKRRAR